MPWEHHQWSDTKKTKAKKEDVLEKMFEEVMPGVKFIDMTLSKGYKVIKPADRKSNHGQ